MISHEAVVTDSLLACFFTECEKEFRFLEQELGFTYYSGLAEYREGRLVIQPYDPGENYESNGQAVTLYEKDATAFEISYNQENFVLDLYLYFGQVYRLELSEMLRAAKKEMLPGMDAPFHVRPAELAKVLKEAALLLRDNKDVILHPDGKILDRALTMREKLLEQRIREQYRKAFDAAREQAARAFLHKDYRQVLLLLSPFERDLDPADVKKLDIARKNLFSA
ncbi:MAG: hypothetical protein IT558_06235 [Alphaproteobacteria bacterium]|nr:hypothetical protein [Alphaproteobacteria bacterium]